MLLDLIVSPSADLAWDASPAGFRPGLVRPRTHRSADGSALPGPELLESSAQHIEVVEQGLSEGQCVRGVLSRHRLSGVVRTLVPDTPQDMRPLGQRLVDRSFLMQCRERPVEVPKLTP